MHNINGATPSAEIISYQILQLPDAVFELPISANRSVYVATLMF